MENEPKKTLKEQLKGLRMRDIKGESKVKKNSEPLFVVGDIIIMAVKDGFRGVKLEKMKVEFAKDNWFVYYTQITPEHVLPHLVEYNAETMEILKND